MKRSRTLLLATFAVLAFTSMAGVGLGSAQAGNVNFRIGGLESEKEALQPKFKPGQFPVEIKGKAYSKYYGVKTSLFYFEAGDLSCGKGADIFVGETLLMPTLTAEERFDPSGLWYCKVLGRDAIIHANGCEFVYRLANAGPPYTGSLELACEAGHALELVVLSSGWESEPLCTLSLPGQPLGTVDYTNETGSEGDRHVKATIVTEYEQFDYSVSGGGGKCGVKGTHHDGEMEGAVEMHGNWWP